MLYAADFRNIARRSLRGRWGMAIATGFVASLLGASITDNGNFIQFNYHLPQPEIGPEFHYNTSHQILNWFQSETGRYLLPWIAGSAIVFLIWSIVTIVIGGAVTLGYSRFNLNIVDQREAVIGDIFSDFRIGAGFCMQFLRVLYVFLWSLLLVIPGIIASYSYAMTPYIMAEHPEYGANEAISRSKEMMRGNRWRLFCLQISFIGWIILSALTMGIGLLWVNPYMETASAAFYREISGTVPDYQAGSYNA